MPQFMALRLNGADASSVAIRARKPFKGDDKVIAGVGRFLVTQNEDDESMIFGLVAIRMAL